MKSPLIMDVADVVAWEQRIAASGTSLLELMSRAGEAVADAALNASAPGARIVIFAGSGNNGGDGWVAARLLDTTTCDYDIRLITPKPADEITAEPAREAACQLQALIDRGASCVEVLVTPSEDELARVLRNADVIVDALLGTGFAHAQVREPIASWIRAIIHERSRRHGVQVLSVDCPSGLNAQTGETADTTVEADKTITMLAIKPGLVGEQSAPYVGELKVATLGQSF